MSQLIIREAEPKDGQGILDIYTPFILHSHTSFEYEVPSLAIIIERIHQVQRQAPWLVATLDDQMAGYAYATSYRNRTAYSWTREVSVYVANGHQRKGIARQLYQKLFRLLALQGYQRVIAGIALPNPESVAFHEKFGLTHAGTMSSVGYKFGQFWDVGFWEMSINETPPGKIQSPKSLRPTQIWKDILQMG